jgi:hypothetical protein
MSEYQTARIARGKAVMDFYRGAYDCDEGDSEVLSDLLADLMHYVEFAYDPEAEGLEFDFELERARHHYEEERREEAQEARWKAEEEAGLPLPPATP